MEEDADSMCATSVAINVNLNGAKTDLWRGSRNRNVEPVRCCREPLAAVYAARGRECAPKRCLLERWGWAREDSRIEVEAVLFDSDDNCRPGGLNRRT